MCRAEKVEDSRYRYEIQKKPIGNNAVKLKARKVEIGRVGTATIGMANQLKLCDRDLNGLQGWSTSRLTNVAYRLLIR